MKTRVASFAAVALCTIVSTAYAIYEVTDSGTWPKTWPVELETLRKQSRTLEGPEVLNLHYGIPFANRAAFESAWPHILKVKSKEAQLILVRGPNFFLGDNRKAGVVVHCPPSAQDDKTAERGTPTTGGNGEGGSRGTAYSIELVVDGKIVDLNRIPLPADTPIVDKRFSEAPQKRSP